MGPGTSDTLLGDARQTVFGWLLGWKTTDVPNGSYDLRSLVYDAAGKVAYSKSIAISVKNR